MTASIPLASIDAGAGMLRFQVADWMAYGINQNAPEQSLSPAYERGNGRGMEPEAVAASAKALPQLLRRRVTEIGQHAFTTATAFGEQSDIRLIFCSRHGEFQRTLGLLKAVVKRDALSPAEFNLSVHNALAGLLSIAWKNKHGHTSISAGIDSFGYGLLEAAAYLAAEPGKPVLLVYFDEPLPDVYAEIADGDDTGVALALLLTSARGDSDDIVIAVEPIVEVDAPISATGQALDFYRFIRSHQNEATSQGAGIRWRWRRAH